MNVLLRAITPVFLHGRIIKPGEQFSCGFEYGKSLIQGKSAELISENTDGAEKKEFTKKELLEIAEKNNVEVKSGDSKTAIEEALMAAGVDFHEDI